MQGATFFFDPDEDQDEIEYLDLPQVVTTHVDQHIPFEDVGNSSSMYAGEIHGKRYSTHLDQVAVGEKIFDVGGLTVVRGSPNNAIICTVPITAPNIDTLQGHVDGHVAYEDPGNTDTLYAGSAFCEKYLSQGDPDIGEAFLSIGGFSILKGDGSNSVTSQYPILAPNILLMQQEIDDATHGQTDSTIVKRNYAAGTRIKNLVCEDHIPFTGGSGEGYRPGFNCETGTCFGDFTAMVNGRFQFFPFQESATPGILEQVPLTEYRFGRSEDDDDPTGVGDGIFMRRDDQGSDGLEHRVSLQVHKTLPSLRITTTKDANVPFIECRDGDGDVMFAVAQNGEVINAWHNTTDLSNLQDQVAHSLFTGVRSLYVGSFRLSWNPSSKVPIFERLTQIPTVLQAAPYSVVTGDLGGVAADEYTAQAYVKLAKVKSGNAALQAKDIFPPANDAADWTECGVDFTRDLTSLCQGQFDGLGTRMTTAESDISVLQAAGGGLGSNETIANVNGNASLTISSTGSSDPVSSLTFSVNDTSVNNEDRSYTIKNDPINHNELVVQHEWLGVQKTPIRIFSTGDISFGGGGNVNAGGFQVHNTDARFFEKVRFYDDLTVDGLVNGETVGHKTKVYSNSSNFQLTDESATITGSGTTRLYPPRMWADSNQNALTGFVFDGKIIDLFSVNTGNQLLEINEVQYAGQGTQFHSQSEGYTSTTRIKLYGAGHWTMVYIESLDQWLVK